MTNTPPTAVIRDGSLKASIWQNEGEKGVFYSTTLAKTYRTQDGKFHDTNRFSGADLLRVSELARQAYSRSNELRRENAPSKSSDPQSDDRQERFEAHQKAQAQDQGPDISHDIDF